MSIKLEQVGNNFFIAKVTPPHIKKGVWVADKLVYVDELINKLLSIGCHQRDIGDALYQIDPKLIAL